MLKVFYNDFDGETHQISVKKSDSIADVKSIILDQMVGQVTKSQKDTFSSSVRLELCGKPLYDFSKVNDCHISENDTLQLKGMLLGGADPTQLIIKSMMGKHYVIEIDLDLKLDDLKQKIQETTSVPIDTQWLCFSGKPMNENKALKEYGLISDSTIHVIARMPGGIMNN